MKFMLTVAILAMTAYIVYAEEPQRAEPQQQELETKRDKRGFAAALTAFPAPYAFAAPYAYASAPLAYAPGFTAPYVAAPLTARAVAAPAFASYTYLA